LRTKEEIIKYAHAPCNFDSVEQMQKYLMLEVLIDIRDVLAKEKSKGGKEE